MWFRADLRIADNTALQAASLSGKDIIACFIVSPEQWRAHDMAPIQCRFMYHNLQAVAEQLRQLNIPLKIIKADTYSAIPSRLKQLCQQFAIDSVYSNREYPVNEKKRDRDCEQLLATTGVRWHSFHDQCIVDPGQVTKPDGTPYVVFTPFSRRWKRQLDVAPVGLAAKPRRQTASAISSDALQESDFVLGEHPSIRWQAGEAAAIKALNTFANQPLLAYKAQRDLPAIDGTSALSPYLALGVISARQCLLAAQQALTAASADQQGNIHCWINELIWRDFYSHILYQFPTVSMNSAFKKATDQLPWRHDSSDFECWCQGQTGIPIIDAAMRQLLTTGWMHNRLRMICAMFLTKNLFIDWRWGEQFFMRHLIDGYFAANNGGWQWSASTGTDAAPYFRIFNPVTQSQRFDPNGDFIRHYVPELADLDDKAIHQPQPDLFSASGYPQPMVDLKASRERAINYFKALQ